MLEKNLTPRVVFDGGFHKTGAIVEGDQSIEYIVTEFVRLRLLPFTLRHVVAFNKGEVYDDEVKMEEPDDFDKKPNDDTQAEQDQFTAHRLAENRCQSALCSLSSAARHSLSSLKKEVPDPLGMPRLGRLQACLVPQHVGCRLYLKSV